MRYRKAGATIFALALVTAGCGGTGANTSDGSSTTTEEQSSTNKTTSQPSPDTTTDNQIPEVRTITSELTANDAVSIDSDGTIYVSEFGSLSPEGFGTGNKVWTATPEGDTSVFVDDIPAPLGHDFDQDGNLVVAYDYAGESGRLGSISADGELTELTTLPGWPSGVAVGPDGDIFVANFLEPVVHRVSPSGKVTEFANDPALAGGVGIDFDSKNNLVVANFSTGEITSITPDGGTKTIAQVSEAVEKGDGFDFAIGYITIADDTIYATGIAKGLIYQISLDGEINVFAGNGESKETDGPLLEASFKSPNGIEADNKTGILYVTGSDAGGLRSLPLPDS